MSEYENENEVANTNDLIEQRRAKLTEWREQGRAYPTHFRRDALAANLLQQHGGKDEPALEAQPVKVSVAGRIMLRRLMGKASFTHIQDSWSHTAVCSPGRCYAGSV